MKSRTFALLICLLPVLGRSAPFTASAPSEARIGYTSKQPVLRLPAEYGCGAGYRFVTSGGEIPVLCVGGIGYLCPTFVSGTYRQTNSVFVLEEPPTVSFPSHSAFPSVSASGVEQWIRTTTYYEPNLTYERAAPLPVGYRQAAYRLYGTATKDTVIPLAGELQTEEPIITRVELLSLNTSGLSPEHYAELSHNIDAESRVFSWGGVSSFTAEWITNRKPSGEKRGGTGPVELTLHHAIGASSTTLDLQVLNSIVIEYEASLHLPTSGRLTFTVEGTPDSKTATVRAIPSGTSTTDLLLLDLTNASSVSVLTGFALTPTGDGDLLVEFEPVEGGKYHLQDLRVLGETEVVSTVPLPNAPANPRGAYVADADYAATLQPVLSLRGSDYVLLDPQAAYDAYSYGAEDPEAIRQALRDLFRDTVTSPSITLVGYASFDPRNELNLERPPQIPCFFETSIENSIVIENSIDLPYTYLDDDDELPDATIGRLPVRTVGELQTVVERVLAAENQGSTALGAAVFVIDDEAEIAADATLWQSYWEAEGHSGSTIALSPASSGAEEREALLNYLQSDLSLLFFSGHGNLDFWTQERLLRVTDLDGFERRGPLPIMMTFTCLNSYYASPLSTERTMSERWLLADGGGVAALAPCSIDFYYNHKPFAEIAMERLAYDARQNPGKTIGQWYTEAQAVSLREVPEAAKVVRAMLLFGDPNTPLHLTAPPASVEKWWLW